MTLLILGGPLAAQGKAPTPEFAVESSFQEIMARTFARECPNLTFDNDGYDRHVRALIAAYSDRGHHSRRVRDLFAPIQPERYEPYLAAFLGKYDLTEDSEDAAFCDAGAAEAEWRTPVGQMLKVGAE